VQGSLFEVNFCGFRCLQRTHVHHCRIRDNSVPPIPEGYKAFLFPIPTGKVNTNSCSSNPAPVLDRNNQLQTDEVGKKQESLPHCPGIPVKREPHYLQEERFQWPFVKAETSRPVLVSVPAFHRYA
jgi:hypothetical protein